MKIVIPGGTGQIGVLLTRHFLRGDNHNANDNDNEIVILTRGGIAQPKLSEPPFSDSRVEMVFWDATTVDESWTRYIDGSDVVINLVGRSVDCRYNDANRAAIMNSRVDSTRAIGEAIALCDSPPAVWLQSSTATIYAHRFDEPNDEATGIIGGEEPNLEDTWKFSIDVAKAWEQTAEEFRTDRTRQVLMRTAMVMSPDADGVFDVLVGLARKFLAGKNGNGEQFVSWIHEADFLTSIDTLIEDAALDGPVNIASPNPIPNEQFMQQLRHAVGVSFGIPSPRLILEIGALVMKTESELLLKSRRVVPGKLLDRGLEFKFPHWSDAAQDLAARLGKR